MADKSDSLTGEYTGHVEPGRGEAARTVEVDGVEVEVRKLSVGPMDNGAYLITDVSACEALLVDAANDADRLLTALGDRRLVAILTTHGDGDHWQALATIREVTGAPVLVHPADAGMLDAPVDTDLVDGARIAFGRTSVEVLHTPGHTPGSCCLLLGRTHLFSGDTLFPGGPGNTQRDLGDHGAIMRSLRNRLFVLPDETWVYPGHGDDTTIGAERGSLDEWESRGW